MYSGADCPWRLMVGVNDLLYVVLECFELLLYYTKKKLMCYLVQYF
jgi:hypothetical protein